MVLKEDIPGADVRTQKQPIHEAAPADIGHR